MSAGLTKATLRKLPVVQRKLALRLECGECKACCSSASAFEIEGRDGQTLKHAWCDCQHNAPKGCAIYPRRPTVCREWACAWRLGLLGDVPELRPDRVGAYVDVSHEGLQQLRDANPAMAARIARTEEVTGQRAVGVTVNIQTTPGGELATPTPAARALMARVTGAPGLVVVILRYADPEWLGKCQAFLTLDGKPI